MGRQLVIRRLSQPARWAPYKRSSSVWNEMNALLPSKNSAYAFDLIRLLNKMDTTLVSTTTNADSAFMYPVYPGELSR